MGADNNHGPSFGTLVSRLGATTLGALRNRGELLAVEYQEERARSIRFFVTAMSGVLLAFMGIALLTASVIFMCPDHARLYVAGGLALLYLAGAVTAALNLRAMINQAPFPESLNQLKKDKEWLESLE